MSFSSENGQKGWGLRLALFFALTISSVIYAADFNISARQTRGVSLGSGGANVDYSLQSRFGQNSPIYKKDKAIYGPGRVISLASARKATNPAAAAVNATIVGAIATAGWIIDELTDQVVAPEYAPLDGYTEGYYYQMPSGALGYTWRDSCEADGRHFIERARDMGATVTSTHCGTGTSPTSPSISSYRYYDRTQYGVYAGVTNQANPVQYQCGTNGYDCSDPVPLGQPTGNVIPIPESEYWPIVKEALENMSPDELREFFNNINGLPELTPELQVLLDDWKQQIEADTGLTGEVTEDLGLDTPQDVSEVIINEDGVKTEPNINDLPDDIYSPLTDYVLPNLPLLPQPDLGLESSATCQTVTFSWRSANVVFPSSSQCSKMNQMKSMMEWLLSVLTLFSCWYIILGQRSAPSV
ncbi:MAG: hypothetical protein JXR18_14115 [Neptuniibacter sp.]